VAEPSVQPARHSSDAPWRIDETKLSSDRHRKTQHWSPQGLAVKRT